MQSASSPRSRWLTLLLLPLLAWAGGPTACTAFKNSAAEVVEASREALGKAAPGTGAAAGKKAALIGVDAGVSGDPLGFSTYYRQQFQGLLQKECAGLRFDAALAADLKAPPRIAAGLLDGYAMALLGRRQGVDFFLVGSLMDVRLEQERTGFWLWKDMRYWIRAVVRVEVVDSATGAKIVDDRQADQTEIDGLKYEELQRTQAMRLPDVQPALDRVLRKSARLVCKALRERPWQAFVVAAEGGAIVLSAGSDAGLAPGRVLEVFGLGAAMVGKDGQRFIPVGEKLGEAVVSAVSRDGAHAAFERWELVKNGGTVRMKR
ncbi:MAG: hypothetical protein MUD16_03555 [Desulfobacterales bacterium]|jgi:hypothetical protein|nr:hypothetical protein [Desulfobacterales bacterium]